MAPPPNERWQPEPSAAAAQDTTGFARDAVEHLLAGMAESSFASSHTAPARFGRYEIKALIGRGGMGTVHLAYDSQLGRDVALKRIRADLLLAPTMRARFETEAKAVARLDHPNVCKVFDAGEQAGELFLVLQYVRGKSLAARIQAASENDATRSDQAALDPGSTLSIAEKIARALHHAHGQGLVHRDVKPSNILIADDGEPYLIDFGLARPTVDAQALTLPGATPGTFRYMSPEQLAGECQVDARTDVFSLGLVLAEALTLRHPFAAGSDAACVHGILHGEPEFASRAGRQPGTDLRTILKTALTKDRAHRYPTALAFAEDLRRVRDHEPILAVPPSRTHRVGLWVRRNRLVAVVVAALVGASLLAGHFARQAQARAEDAALATYARDALVLAHEEHLDPTAALARAVAAADADVPHRLDTLLWRRLDACGLGYRIPRALGSTNGFLCGVPAIDGTGGRMACITDTGRLRVWRTADGFADQPLQAHDRASDRRGTVVAFHPREPLLYSGGCDGLLKTWRAGDGEQVDVVAVAETGDAAREILSVAIDAGGRHLAAADHGARVLVKDLSTGHVRRVSAGTGLSVGAIRWSPDGTRLLVSMRRVEALFGECEKLVVLDATTGSIAWERPFAGDAVASAQWHPCGDWLAVGTVTGRIAVLAAGDGRQVAEVVRRSADPAVRWCGFDPAGANLIAGVIPGFEVFAFAGDALTSRHTFVHPKRRSMVTASFAPGAEQAAAMFRDGSVLLLRTEGWRTLQAYAAPPYATDLLAVQWAGDALITSRNDDLLVWKVQPRPWLPHLFLHSAPLSSVDVHPDGDRVLTASDDGTVCLASLTSAARRRLQVGAPVAQARFNSGGRRFVVTDRAGQVMLHDTETQALLVRTSGSIVDAVDDDRLLVADRRSLWLVRVADGQRTLLGTHTGEIHALAVDHRRRRAYIGGDYYSLRELEIDDPRVSGEMSAVLASHLASGSVVGRFSALAWLPRSDRLIMSACNALLAVWQLGETLTQSRRESRADRFGGLIAVDHDERHAVLSDFGFGRVTWLDLRTLDLDATVQSDVHTEVVTAIRFSHDGTLCLTASLDGTVQIWDCATRRIRSVLSLAGTTVHDACFTPDDRWIVTGDGHGTVKAWPVDPLPAAKAYLRGLAVPR